MEELFSNSTVLAAAIFLLVAGCCLAIGAWTGRVDRRIESRIRGACESIPQSTSGRGNGWSDSVASGHVILHRDALRDPLCEALAEAGIHDPRAKLKFHVCQGCFAAIGASLCLLLSRAINLPLPLILTWSAASMGLGYMAPRIWLWRRQIRRQLALRRSIPDFLDLVVACLSGGYSIQAALKQVSEELRLAHPLLSMELSLMLREIDMGSTLDTALRNLTERTRLEELRTLRSFVHQTMKFGTTIIDGLQELSEMLRNQREQRAEELAQKAAVKILLPTFLFIFPTVFVVLVGPAAIKIQQGLFSTLSK